MLIPTVPALMRRATRCPRAGSTVWTGDPARGHRVARRIKAGTVGINMPYTAFPGIPFGGYKQSGFGRELGLETLELYLETKSVIVSTRPKPGAEILGMAIRSLLVAAALGALLAGCGHNGSRARPALAKDSVVVTK